MTTQSITTLILGTAPENATPATHILAGPWCTAPASAEETGFDMPPEPLADPERLETAARQARQLVTQLAPRLRDYLNGLYGTQHDDRYWDFVLAPWLVRAVETLIDRLYRTAGILETFGGRPLSVPVLDASEFAFADTQDFIMGGILNPQWNHWLFSRLLKRDWPAAWTAEELPPVQRLYERGYVSYPRTGCRHIPEDIFEQAPTLVASLKGHPRFGRHAERLLEKGLNPHAVDGNSVTEHHALLITGEVPEGLSPDEQNIYSLIAGRMLEAFSEGCVREVVRVRADYGGMEFEAETSCVKYPGWRDIYNGPDMAEESTPLPQFHQGETLAVLETEILEDSTKPLPPFTEAGLLAAMENADGTADGESKKKITERCGLGTPGTRAGIIDLLVARRYVERIGNRLIPTEKGLEIYGIVGDKLIADAAMTAAWEEALREIEEGRLSAGKFMKGIHEYARKIVSELLALQVRNPGVTRCACPKCGTGTVTLYDRVAKCGDPDCAFHLPRMFNGREMTDEEMTRLMAWEATPFLKFTTKAGKPYEASLRMDENYKVELTFKDSMREL